jgi:hypothetical protein
MGIKTGDFIISCFVKIGRKARILFLTAFFVCIYTLIPAQQVTETSDSLTKRNIAKEYNARELRTFAFFDSSRTFTTGNKWINELQNSVIRPPKDGITDTLPTLRTELEFLQYEGYIIRSIRFVKLDVFGATIIDTSAQTSNWFEKRGNMVHIKTNNRILERHLLINEGDAIDPRVLADNVRLFRDQSYIEDARIIVEPVSLMNGFADILIIVKDQWSKAFFIEMSDVNAGKIEVWDRNIFGTGKEIQNNFHWNPEKYGTWGYEAIYNNRNILGSFVDGKFHYTSVFERESYGMQFNRKFYTPNTKYAGGASAYYLSSMRNIWNSDSGYFYQQVSSKKADIWIGRSLKLNKNAEIFKNRVNLIVASRLYKENYIDRPEVSDRLYYEFHDKSVWLNTIALSSQSFYQSNLIYSYGRTEDIPIGSLVNFTFGPEFGEFNNRMYTSISFSGSNYITNLGYWYLQIGEGGFLTKSGNFEQAIFQLRLKYISNLFIYNRFKFRQFFNVNFTRGVKRFEDDRITINEQYGLRGFNESNVVGLQRLNINMETVAFTPWYSFGFRFTFFGYMDFALLGSESTNLLYEDVYTGLGIGTRIKNERLVFPTFSFRLGFYPNLKDLPFSERMHFSGEPKLQPDNFYVTSPEMIGFR